MHVSFSPEVLIVVALIVAIASLSSVLTLFLVARHLQREVEPRLVAHLDRRLEESSRALAEKLDAQVRQAVADGVKQFPSLQMVRATEQAVLNIGGELVRGGLLGVFERARGFVQTVAKATAAEGDGDAAGAAGAGDEAPGAHLARAVVQAMKTAARAVPLADGAGEPPRAAEAASAAAPPAAAASATAGAPAPPPAPDR